MKFQFSIKLYQGDRLQGLVDSIKEHGIIVPVVVRAIDNNFYEILSGHNRVHAAQMAGLEAVPVIIKEGLSEEEANLIVTESNLIQRSFSDLSHSERAIALKRHYEMLKINVSKASSDARMKSKQHEFIKDVEALTTASSRHNLTSLSQVATKQRPTERVGIQFSLSRDTVARYLRLSQLSETFLQMVNNNVIAFIPAVIITYLRKAELDELERVLIQEKCTLSMAKAKQLKQHSEAGCLSSKLIHEILSGIPDGNQKIKEYFQLKSTIISQYFKSDQDDEEINQVIEKALKIYFNVKH